MKNADIGMVLKQGKSFRSKSFLFLTLPIPSWSKPAKQSQKNKPAFIAGKKIFKTAVLRNKVRRKMKAATQQALKKAPKDNYFVFSLNKEVLTATQTELRSEAENILRKGGMLKD